jgi:hypothetical protein
MMFVVGDITAVSMKTKALQQNLKLVLVLLKNFSKLLYRLRVAYLIKVPRRYRSFATRVSQLKIWHF